MASETSRVCKYCSYKKIAAEFRVGAKTTEWHNYRRKNGNNVRIIHCLRTRIKSFLKAQYGLYIDHINPLSSFNSANTKQQYEACHYTNLQLLWWRDNLVEGGAPHSREG